MNEILLSERLPVLPLRGMTVFPKMLIHFDVGRDKSVEAVERAMNMNQQLFLVTQRDILIDDPGNVRDPLRRADHPRGHDQGLRGRDGAADHHPRRQAQEHGGCQRISA